MSEGFYLSITQAPTEKNYAYSDAFADDGYNTPVYRVHATYAGTTLLNGHCGEEDLQRVTKLVFHLRDQLSASILQAEQDWQYREHERELREQEEQEEEEREYRIVTGEES